MQMDVVIVGGGPGGLAAALTLGRARKRVLLCDAGSPRNAAAEHIHNFVTRDGTPPAEFRQIGHAQLSRYANVDILDARVESITGTRGNFQVHTSTAVYTSRRVLLCTGMIDELPEIEGFQALWGHSIFQCPYCHGWEVQDRRWGVLAGEANAQMVVPFALSLRGWTDDVVVFADETFRGSEDALTPLKAAGIPVETGAVTRLIAQDGHLEAVELSTGLRVPCDVLLTHPTQRQVALVQSLDVTLDDHGYVQVDPMSYQTSIPGVYAAGDLTTRGQGAIWAAAAAARAATMINMDLTMERVRPRDV